MPLDELLEMTRVCTAKDNDQKIIPCVQRWHREVYMSEECQCASGEES